jgi:competence protein ComEC
VRSIATAVLLAAFILTARAAGTLEIFFIDVEGGESTLLVSPSGQSLLIDAGYAGRGSTRGRDAERIAAVVREAGLERLDYLLVTHFHPDHVGGVPELATRVPIGTFIDIGEPLGTDRMTGRGFRNYEPIRSAGRHIVVQAGERLPLSGLEATVVSAGGHLIPQALPGGGQPTSGCADAEDHPEDGTENFRSIGVLFELGRFRFLDLGDLSGNTLTRLACPMNMVGPVSAYLVAHHGDYDSNNPALYAALRPRVAIMNNGPTKGGSPNAFRTLGALPGLEGLWQLHASLNPGARNAPDDFVANIDGGDTSYWLRLTAVANGSFSVTNGRTGREETYAP